MAKRINVFYAFPSDPPTIGECIEQAINALKSEPTIRERRIRFRPWTSMAVGGKSLISTITENIRRSDIFACDLTYPNFNVTFELGFAIAKFKRIWLSLNSSIENAPRDFKRIYSGMLGGLGYEPYVNYKNLVDAFVSSPPWVDLDASPLAILTAKQRSCQSNLLYFTSNPRLTLTRS